MIGKVVTGCVAILPYHTATQDRGSECRDFGFISRIVTALAIGTGEIKKTHTFIIAIYTHYLANSISKELPALFMCNDIQTFVYDAFLRFPIQKRDCIYAEEFQHTQHESPF